MTLTQKVNLITLLCTLVATVVIAVFSFTHYRDMHTEVQAYRQQNIAQSIAVFIDPAQLEYSMETGNVTEQTLHYQRTIEYIAYMTDAYLLFIGIPQPGVGISVYLYTVPGQSYPLGLPSAIGSVIPYYLLAPEAFLTMETGLAHTTGILESGVVDAHVILAYAPIFDNSSNVLAVVGLSTNAEAIILRTNTFVIQLTIITFLILMIFTVLAFNLFKEYFTRPIQSLITAAEKLSKGDFSTDFSMYKDSAKGDEIHTLLHSFYILQEEVKNVIKITDDLVQEIVSGSLFDTRNDYTLQGQFSNIIFNIHDVKNIVHQYLNELPYAFTIIGTDYKTTFVNKAFIAMDFQTRETLVGQSLFDISYEDPNHKIRDAVMSAKITRKPVRLQIDTRFLEDVGKARVHDVYVIPIFDTNRGVASYSIVAYDITELMDTQKGLKLQADEIADLLVSEKKQKENAMLANRSKTNFLRSISHEIRTPLNSILGNIDILSQSNLTEETQAHLFRISTAANVLLSIINDLLDISKIESDKLTLIEKPYDLTNLIIDASAINAPFIQDKLIEFKIFLDPETPSMLIGDSLRIKQVINNILSNAFKYTERGMVALQMYYELSTSSLIFVVADTGRGMTREQVSKIFDMYTRFEESTSIKTIEGTGLGMGITRSLLTLMKGEILVESEVDFGTVFTVRIPQKIHSHEVVGKETSDLIYQAKPNNMGSAYKKRDFKISPMPGAKVLVVDDIETNLYVAVGLMASYLLDIDTVTSGLTVIDMIRDGKEYDIIFMDYMMPVMTGMDVTKILREELKYKKPIVALTADAVLGQEEYFLENGFDAYMTKPIDTRYLNHVLNSLIPEDKKTQSIQPTANTPSYTQGSILTAFMSDITKTINELKRVTQNKLLETSEGLASYVINTHGIKTGLYNMKFDIPAGLSKELEQRGKLGDVHYLYEHTPPFILELEKIKAEMVGEIDKLQKGQNTLTTAKEDKNIIREKFTKISESLEIYDISTIEDILKEISELPKTPETQKTIETIETHIIHSDFDKIAEIIKEYEDKH
ncbi:MAG: ATP-binding protein [Defluviitaleaceae bacterium]|nr:ATP-binding protein [Defluviitaleaceae bacterium]